MYLYESGSAFESVVNQYMTSGKGTNPFDPRGRGVEGTTLNATVAGATLGANAVFSDGELGPVPTSSLPGTQKRGAVR